MTTGEGYRVQAGEPPEGLDGEELETWWKQERRRMCAEMHRLADFLFGEEDQPNPMEIH